MVVTKIAVGPSAPPIMAIAPDCDSLKPRKIAPVKVTKIPICAAAPKIRLLGLEISGPKSVIQPIPRKIKGG